jgi:hypothetical protein
MQAFGHSTSLWRRAALPYRFRFHIRSRSQALSTSDETLQGNGGSHEWCRKVNLFLKDSWTTWNSLYPFPKLLHCLLCYEALSFMSNFPVLLRLDCPALSVLYWMHSTVISSTDCSQTLTCSTRSPQTFYTNAFSYSGVAVWNYKKCCN